MIFKELDLRCCAMDVKDRRRHQPRNMDSLWNCAKARNRCPIELSEEA